MSGDEDLGVPVLSRDMSADQSTRKKSTLIGYAPSSSWAHKTSNPSKTARSIPLTNIPIVSPLMARGNVPVPSRQQSSPQSQRHSTYSSSSRASRQYSSQRRQPTTSSQSRSPSQSLDDSTDTQLENYTDTQMVRDIGRAFGDAANFHHSEGDALADGGERPSKKK